jgi:hypothetical protein
VARRSSIRGQTACTTSAALRMISIFRSFAPGAARFQRDFGSMGGWAPMGADLGGNVRCPQWPTNANTRPGTLRSATARA